MLHWLPFVLFAVIMICIDDVVVWLLCYLLLCWFVMCFAIVTVVVRLGLL